MAHPTRTGDVVAFSYPPYQFDAETPGTLVAPSQFFGQHGYIPAVQDLAANINMRATFLAGGEGIAKGEVSARTIDLAPTLAAISAGSVFMGANSYIGNAPNLMVKAIAEDRGVKMPSFFGYMAWSVGILIPLFIVMTFIWFR